MAEEQDLVDGSSMVSPMWDIPGSNETVNNVRVATYLGDTITYLGDTATYKE